MEKMEGKKYVNKIQIMTQNDSEEHETMNIFNLANYQQRDG